MNERTNLFIGQVNKYVNKNNRGQRSADHYMFLDLIGFYNTIP